MTTGVDAMTHKNKIKAAVLGISLAAASLAQAQAPTINRGVYFGGALGQSEAKEFDCTAQPQCENRGSVGRIFLGLQFGRHWAFELAATDLGQVSLSNPSATRTVKVRAAEAVLLPSYPFTERFMAYGRAGGYYAQTTDDQAFATGPGNRIKESNGGITWGFGLQYYVTNSIALRGEMQRYMKVGGGNIGDSDYNAVTVGALFKMR